MLNFIIIKISLNIHKSDRKPQHGKLGNKALQWFQANPQYQAAHHRLDQMENQFQDLHHRKVAAQLLVHHQSQLAHQYQDQALSQEV